MIRLRFKDNPQETVVTQRRFALLGAAVLLFAQASKADFGEAEVGGTNNEARTFEAWCAKRGNSCRVQFGEGMITINGKDTVPFERISSFNYNANNGTCNAYGFWCIGRAYTFDIIYTKVDGSEGVGKIIFAKENVALSFMHNLKNATGNRPWAGDPRCERGQVYQNGICLSPSNAAEVRTRERESENASQAVIEHGRAIGAGLAVQGELQKQGLENVRVEQNTGVIVVPR